MIILPATKSIVFRLQLNGCTHPKSKAIEPFGKDIQSQTAGAGQYQLHKSLFFQKSILPIRVKALHLSELYNNHRFIDVCRKTQTCLSSGTTNQTQWKLNASVGRYFKTPIYTVLGFRDLEGNFLNRDSKYIRSDHYVAGVEFLPTPSTRFTVESFYKRYANYPVSARDGISLANQGGEFGAIGNEQVESSGRGRAYGAEFFFQQKLTKKLFAVFSYTFVCSEFTGLDGETYIPSAWDNRHLVSALLGRKFSRGWELGLKYRFAGGVPYTPFDSEASRRNYLSLGTGVLDYSRLNTQRLPVFSQFDFRVDKKWNWRRFTLDLFLDVQNAFLTPGPTLPAYTFGRTEDNSRFASADGRPLQLDGSNAIPLILDQGDATVLPTIGFIIEF